MKLTRARMWYRYSAKRRVIGQISGEAFRGEVEKLVATDDSGRTWHIHPEPPTGLWVLDEEGERYEAVPPGCASSAVLTEEQLYGEGSAGALLVSAVVVYAIIAGILWLFVDEARHEPGVFAGLGLAVGIGVIIALVKRSGGWKGRVTGFREEKVWIPSQYEQRIPGRYEMRMFALITDDRGRTRRLPAMPSWQEGDRVSKRRGSMSITREP